MLSATMLVIARRYLNSVVQRAAQHKHELLDMKMDLYISLIEREGFAVREPTAA